MKKRTRWDRRSFLKAGAAGAAGIGVGCAPTLDATPRDVDGAPRFHTALCDTLGVRYPIVQSGMGGVSGAELAAAVSNAGGLGILAAAHLEPAEVRRRIREVRRLTDRPFGVNLLLHPQLQPPVDAAALPESLVHAVQRTLNRFRERLGLEPSFARPATRPDHIPGAIEVILDERVPVFSIGMGSPPPTLVARFHAQGTKVIAMAATVADARELAASGVDAVVAQGHEAGGHRSTWREHAVSRDAHVGTMALLPQVVDAVDVPVIAAGGITNGRGIVAALALGSQGALLGTRFVATRESLALDFYRHALVRSSSDETTVTDAYSGLVARVLRNDFTSEYEASGAPTLPGYLQTSAAADILRAAAERSDGTLYPMWAGQGVGMIGDVPDAGAIVAALVVEARMAMSRLASAVATGHDATIPTRR